MTTYTFDQQLVVDPITFTRAPNSSVTIYDVNDTGNTTPLPLTDLNGLTLSNPLTSSSDAFLPAFQASAAQVKFVSPTLSSVIVGASYDAVLQQATDAKNWVQGIGVAATNTGDPGTAAAVSIDADGNFTFDIPQGAPGPQGIPGVNAVPADTAVAGYVNDSSTQSRGALDGRYGLKGGTVYVESFRDGVRTDAQIISAAFGALAAGGCLKFGQGKTYTLSSGAVYDLTTKADVLLDGQGATIDGSALTSGTILQIKGGSGSVQTSLTAAVTSRTKTLTVASTAGYAAGDMVTLRSSGELFNPERPSAVKQEIVRIASVVDGVTLALEAFTWNTYSLTGYTVNVLKVPPMRNLRVRELTVKGAGTGANVSGLQFVYFDGLRTENVTVDGAGVEGLYGGTGLDWIATGCRAFNNNTSGVGYGFHAVTVQNVRFIGCVGRNNRHSYDVDETRDITYQSCFATADLSAGFSTHGSTDTAKFFGCTVKDCGGGMVGRGQNHSYIGNHITGSRNYSDSSQSYVHGITLGDDGSHAWGVGLAGTGLIIRDNHIDISGPDWTGLDSSGIYCTAALVDAVISGNHIAGYSAHGINSKGDYGLRVKVADNRLDSSGQLGTYGTTAYHGILLSPSHGIDGNTYNEVEISGNRISGAQYNGIRVKGNPTSTANVSDNIAIHDNTVGACGVAAVCLSDGYYGYRLEVTGNEWLGLSSAAAVMVAASTYYLAMPFIGANGWGSKGRRPLAQGGEMGARLRPTIYYGTPGVTGSTAATQSQLYAVPFFIPRQTTLDRIAVNITTAGAAGSVARLGIYADVLDSYGGYPGALVLDAGTIAADSTGFKEITISQTLAPGLYWLAAVAQGGAPSWTVITSTSSQAVGYQASGTVAGRLSWVQSGVTGALPSAFTSSLSSQGSAPLVQVRPSA